MDVLRHSRCGRIAARSDRRATRQVRSGTAAGDVTVLVAVDPARAAVVGEPVQVVVGARCREEHAGLVLRVVVACMARVVRRLDPRRPRVGVRADRAEADLRANRRDVAAVGRARDIHLTIDRDRRGADRHRYAADPRRRLPCGSAGGAADGAAGGLLPHRLLGGQSRAVEGGALDHRSTRSFSGRRSGPV